MTAKKKDPPLPKQHSQPTPVMTTRSEPESSQKGQEANNILKFDDLYRMDTADDEDWADVTMDNEMYVQPTKVA